MRQLPTHHAVYRAIWTADAHVSSALFEIRAKLSDWGSAYSSWLYRWFRLSRPKQTLVFFADEVFTITVAVIFAMLAYALPPFKGDEDVWNRNRQYAVTFTDQDGKFIGRRGISQNDSVPLDEIPPVLIKAVLATEDARFYDHFGMDVIGTLRALRNNARGGSTQGGSSITQQVVKNILLTPEKTLTRKVHEAFLSLWVEARRSKNEILKLYLDRSYLGGGAYGVEAASQFYFGKSVRDINLPEAAVLAGLFKAPTQYAPHANPEASKARTNVVLYRMLDSGFITQGELLQAQRRPAEIVKQDIIASPNWFMDFAYQDTLAVMERQGLKGNFVVEVKTTVNSKLQQASQAIINDVIDNLGPNKGFSQGSSITMAPDGAVRAIVGGRDYEDSQFNRATTAKRQVGSAFKPFVYMTALLKGYKRDTTVVDGPVCVVNWCVHNFEDGYVGQMPLWKAFAHSYNTVAVKLMVDVGRKQIEATAHRMGIQGYIDPYPTMSIGTSALTLMDLATGYATIAQDGKLAKPYAVLEIRKPNGDLLYNRATNEKDAEQVEPEDKIAELTSIMHTVLTEGTARSSNLTYAPAAGKTGTNANHKDAWFVGFTAHNVTGVWVGNDDNTPMNNTRENGVTGGRVPAPAWRRIMDVAEFGLKPESIAGVALDASYTLPPTEIADVAVTGLSSPTPAATAAPDIKPSVTSATDTEAGSPDLVVASGEQADAESQSVLNGMIDLFQGNDSQTAAQSKPASAQPGATAPRSGLDRPARPHRFKVRLHRPRYYVPRTPLVESPAPPPPRRKSFLELLFGSR